MIELTLIVWILRFPALTFISVLPLFLDWLERKIRAHGKNKVDNGLADDSINRV